MIERHPANPLISPSEVAPSRDDLEVMCVFNPGATLHDGRTILLVRVAERPIPQDGFVSTAFLDPADRNGLTVLHVRRDDPDLDFSDPRLFHYRGDLYLTSISHLRLAVSDDGRNFTVSDTPTLAPEEPYEEFGIEDARITFIDGAYYINYSAISRNGVCTCLARTTDFKRYEKLGIMFAPDNKDIAIFPEKIGGRYYCFHRPSTKQIGAPSMWIASSDNLLDWGRHQFLIGPQAGSWDSERVGCGPAPIRTSEGWLEFYHGADENIRYCTGALLLDLNEPWKIVARSSVPILPPEMEYEQKGMMPNVVFCNGHVERDDGKVDLYYGATDETVCVATADVDAVLAALL